MTRGRVLVGVLMGVIAGALAWVLFVGLPRWYGAPARPSAAAPTPTPTPDDVRKIKVRLFYLDAEGTRLVSTEREVPYAADTAAQARAIVAAQLSPAVGSDADTVPTSAIPAGTTLRALFVAPPGTAYVDLSAEVTTAHPGGTTNELLTVYTIVQALTTNLPAISSVQILVDGKEVDTLAGHVDIKRPLPRSDEWVSAPGTPATTSDASAPATAPTTAAAPPVATMPMPAARDAVAR